MIDKLKNGELLAIALLYKNKYINDQVLTEEELINFEEEVLKNLSSLSDSFKINNLDYYDKPVIFKYKKEDNEMKYVLKDNINIGDAWNRYISNEPLFLILATLQENSLNAIGMKINEGKIEKIEDKEKSKKLTN